MFLHSFCALGTISRDVKGLFVNNPLFVSLGGDPWSVSSLHPERPSAQRLTMIIKIVGQSRALEGSWGAPRVSGPAEHPCEDITTGMQCITGLKYLKGLCVVVADVSPHNVQTALGNARSEERAELYVQSGASH